MPFEAERSFMHQGSVEYPLRMLLTNLSSIERVVCVDMGELVSKIAAMDAKGEFCGDG